MAVKAIKTWIRGKIRSMVGVDHLISALESLVVAQIKDVRAEADEHVETVSDRLKDLGELIGTHFQEAERRRGLYLRDILLILDRLAHFTPTPAVELETDHPIASESNDHRFPLGAANDNTRSPRFVRACEALFGHPLKVLDLGCAGGGLILDFVLRGHLAIGLEGSDFPLRQQAAEWRVLPNNLFTCDITRPFQLRFKDSQEPLRFDVISAWEVLEHIPEDRLPSTFENIQNHLADDGVFVASVATFECSDPNTGAVYHVTIKDRPWWKQQLAQSGFQFVEGLFHPLDPARGTGNGPPWFDWSAITNPEMGFHIVAKRTESA